jgi:hypothetical protein
VKAGGTELAFSQDMLKPTCIGIVLASLTLLVHKNADACSPPSPPPPPGTITEGILGASTQPLPKDVALTFGVRLNGVTLAQVAAFLDVKVSASDVEVPGALFEVGQRGAANGIFAWRPASGVLPVGALSVSYNQRPQPAEGGNAGRTTVSVVVRAAAWQRPGVVDVEIGSVPMQDPQSRVACAQDFIGGCGGGGTTPYYFGIKKGITIGPLESSIPQSITVDASYIERSVVYEMRDAEGKVLESINASELGRVTFAARGTQVCAKVTDRRVDDQTLVFAHPETCLSVANQSADVTQADLTAHKARLAGACRLPAQDLENGVNEANGNGGSGSGCNASAVSASPTILLALLLLRGKRRRLEPRRR